MMPYRVVILGCGRPTGYWRGGNSRWTTDERFASRLSMADAEAVVRDVRKIITPENLRIEATEC